MRKLKIMWKKIGISVLMVLASAEIFGQIDPQFSQFYAAPLLLNPGFTGSTAEHRLIFNGRVQWPNLPKAYQTMAFSYDFWRPELKSGFGLQLLTDKAGTAGLRYTTARVNYSYKIVANKWVISPGIYFGYSSRTFDPNKLLFGDQLDYGGGTTPPSLDPNAAKLRNVNFFDTGVGLLFYTSRAWYGASVYQLNQPNSSIIDGNSPWPRKYVINGGLRVPIYGDKHKSNMVSSLSPSFMYRIQGGTHQLDIGMQYMISPVVIGLWYRGVPVIKNYIGEPSNEAVVFSMGLMFNYFEFGYSYDFTVSDLSAQSGGAHEVSLMYEFKLAPHPRHVKRKYKMIPCPTFNNKSNSGVGMFRKN